jgi:hypothetical protein
METRLLFLIILILSIWLLFSNKGKKLINNMKNNITNIVMGNSINESEVETDG